MNKIILLSLLLLTLVPVLSREHKDERTILIINKYSKLSPECLIKMGDKFSNKNMFDSAVICYQMIYNNTDNQNIEFKKIACRALNNAFKVYFYNCDYHSSLELLLRGLTICEDIGYYEYISRIYNNIGNIYYQFKDYKQAKKYYDLALLHCESDYVLGIILNNLGLLSHAEGKLDSALLLYKKAYKIMESDSVYSGSLNNIGLIHESLKNYDSALLYYRMALSNARRFDSKDRESRILSDIGSLYFETNKFDSSNYYIKQSSCIATENKLLDVLADNFLAFQKMAEKRGNFKESLDYYKRYHNINDSLFNISKYGKIGELQFMYDMAKVDRKIKELNVEQTTKEQTILMQNRLQIIMGLILLIVIVFLILLYAKNRTLNRAYNVLFDKNIEIVESDKLNKQMRQEYEELLINKDLRINELENRIANSAGIDKVIFESPKLKRSNLSDNSQNDLIKAILEVMSNNSIFCDPDFSIEKLSEIVNSNKTYISHIINDTFGKNFRSFINDYRIKEARRMFSEIEYRKYSIESISSMVGFKSKSQFNIIFKEVTGVTPSFYVKSLGKQ